MPRRPKPSRNAFSAAPMRVPPDQSGAASVARRSATSGWRGAPAPGSAGSAGWRTRTPRPARRAPHRAAGAGRRGRTGAIDPDTSASSTRRRGRRRGCRYDRRTGSPPVARARRSDGPQVELAARGGGATVRRDGRSGVVHGRRRQPPAQGRPARRGARSARSAWLRRSSALAAASTSSPSAGARPSPGPGGGGGRAAGAARGPRARGSAAAPTARPEARAESGPVERPTAACPRQSAASTMPPEHLVEHRVVRRDLLGPARAA